MSKYPLYQLSEFDYYFEVEELEGIQYKVEYSSSSHLLPTKLIDNDIYEMSFSRIGVKSGHTRQISKRIEKTISFALVDFITKFKCPIVFICDSLDNRHFYRLTLFNSWYNNLENKEPYTFEMRELITDEGLSYYTGMVILNDHPKLIELVAEFDSPEIFSDKA